MEGWKRTTNKLSPCFVSRFPVWAKIVIDTVVFLLWYFLVGVLRMICEDIERKAGAAVVWPFTDNVLFDSFLFVTVSPPLF